MVRVGADEVHTDSEGVSQKDFRFDLLIVIRAQFLALDFAHDTVARLHEVLRDLRRFESFRATRTLHESVEQFGDERAHLLLVGQEEGLVVAEEAALLISLLDCDGRLLLELGQ